MASSKNTPTAAGAKGSDPSVTAERQRLMDAIDRMFAEFELMYHNQFHKAFADAQKLMYAKRLWLSHLEDCDGDEVLAAARQATRESEYLPTVHSVLKHIDALRCQGMPEAHDAYLEACLAPAPHAAHPWSHVAVYWAGVQCGWQFLAGTAERDGWPVFARHYRQLMARVAQGETLPAPTLPALPETVHHPLTDGEREAAIAALKQAVKL